MSLVVTGLSHHTSALALRERLAFAEDTLPSALAQLRKRLAGGGAVILSTCNRVEIYAHQAGDAADLFREIRTFLAGWHEIDESEFSEALYEYQDREVVGHLFRVAASLDSLVVGEQQILGQVHDAYLVAHAEQATDKVINQLFQKAFTVAKRVRSQSDIGAGRVSVSSVAVDLAGTIFGNLAGRKVMVVGSGEMAELTLKSLVARGVGDVLIANRSLINAEELAAIYHGTAIDLHNLGQHLAFVDIVISSTGSADTILDRDTVARAARERGATPMFIIDIAVPRDVAPAVNEVDNVYLYDIDDLQEVADRNMAARRQEVDRGLELVENGADQFYAWLRSLAAEPTIVSLSHEFDEIRRRELAKTRARWDGLSEAEREEELDYLTRRLMNNYLQRPLTQLKQEVHHEDHVSVLQLVRRLFGLKEST